MKKEKKVVKPTKTHQVSSGVGRGVSGELPKLVAYRNRWRNNV